MRFDDRLRTVLAQPAADPHDRAVRWRQLVELVARAGGDADREIIGQALDEIQADRKSIDERVRIAAALAVAPLPLPAELVAIFASDRMAVAAPVLASAKLTASEWKTVSDSASVECRAFIASMRSEAPEAAPPASAPGPPREPETIPSISEVVARVERLRQAREREAPADAPVRETAEDPRLFRWECNESGEIEWVDGAPRGALVGQSIAQAGTGGGVDRSVERAFAARAPFHEGVLELARGGTVGGTWKISGVPAFEPATGRFAGYRGVAERSNGHGLEAGTKSAGDTDSLRELAHEIKTPLNAIIGFAEIINGEYLGPAEGHFRERAGEIVAQARMLLSAVEELDFAARLRSSAQKAGEVDLGRLMEQLIIGLREEAAGRGVELEASRPAAESNVAVDPEIAERLIVRLCNAVIARASQGERLRVSVDRDRQYCTVSISRPASMMGIDLRPERNRRATDAATLPLRLVVGLARTAGGELEETPSEIRLLLPKG